MYVSFIDLTPCIQRISHIFDIIIKHVVNNLLCYCQQMYFPHLPLVPHICISESGQHWFIWWLVAYSTTSHYLNQCWVIINWILRNKLHWNVNQNSRLFLPKIALENIVWGMAAILSRGRWVNECIFLICTAWFLCFEAPCHTCNFRHGKIFQFFLSAALGDISSISLFAV